MVQSECGRREGVQASKVHVGEDHRGVTLWQWVSSTTDSFGAPSVQIATDFLPSARVPSPCGGIAPGIGASESSLLGVLDQPTIRYLGVWYCEKQIGDSLHISIVDDWQLASLGHADTLAARRFPRSTGRDSGHPLHCWRHPLRLMRPKLGRTAESKMRHNGIRGEKWPDGALRISG
jgi:hypothetical protein